MNQVIPTPASVLPYEPFGFTNRVRFDNLLYLSGSSAVDPEVKVVGHAIAAQTVYTYRNIELVLRARRSELDRILQMTSFVVDLGNNGGPYVETRKTILTNPTFTSATIGIGIAALMVPGPLLKVQCMAVVC